MELSHLAMTFGYSSHYMLVMYCGNTGLSCTHAPHVSRTSFVHVPSGTGVDEVSQWVGNMRLAPSSRLAL